MTEDEILSDLRGDGVTHIRRLTTFKDGQRRDTSLLVLTFNSTSLPEKLNIGWLRKDVRVFIPNPLRCFKCRRFGHGSSTCRQSARCQRRAVEKILTKAQSALLQHATSAVAAPTTWCPPRSAQCGRKKRQSVSSRPSQAYHILRLAAK